MQNLFLEDIKSYADKCSQFFLNGELTKYFTSLCETSQTRSYYDVFSNHCDGGKRIRAYLVKLGYELCGKTPEDNIILPSLSYELFQTGVLSHDDIIDQSPTRRHKPSMHVELGNNHLGVSRSICQGDFGIIASLDIITRSDFTPETKLKALQHQSKVYFSTVAGELQDVDLSDSKEHILEDILEMYRLKTAQYTVAGPMVLGAILAGADDDMCSKLCDIGTNIGIAFQIKDDILGIFGDEKTVGKSVLSDMREGKKTVLSAHFLQNASKNDAQTFSCIYGKSDADNIDLEIVRKLFTKVGSYEFSNMLCADYVRKASNGLSELQLPQQTSVKFNQMLTYMTSREK